MAQRLKREIKVCNGEPMMLKIGTMNRLNPISFSITGKGWIVPNSEENYEKTFRLIKRCLNKKIGEIISESDMIDENYILNVEISTEKMRLHKKSYIYYDVYFKQTGHNGILMINDLAKKLSSDIFEINRILTDKIKDCNFSFI